MKRFSVGLVWSRYPGGRKIAHGPWSGEQFLLQVLVPLWKEWKDGDEKIAFDFEDCMGATIGFLDSSFGELAALYGKAAVLERFAIFGKTTVEDEIDGVLTRADKTCRFKTPELDKIRATKRQREIVQSFMEWCSEQKPSLHLAIHDPHDRRGFVVRDVDWQPHCTKWLEIDEAKAERERDLILSQIREKQDLEDRSDSYVKKHGRPKWE